MSKLGFWESIFSITNVGYQKQICVLGIKFKYNRHFNYKGVYDYLPIQNNKIVFRTNSGSYTCNPKYIAEEIMRQNLPYELVWIVNKNILKYIEDYPKNIKLVMIGTNDDLREAATAKIWIDNERRTYFIRKVFWKRPQQTYIQTFHGSMGIKKTGLDRNDLSSDAIQYMKIDSEQIDYLTSNSKWETDFFKRMFWDNGKILEIGHPRNDIFFKDNTLIKEKVYKYYNIPTNKKIVLYAPTLREDRDMSCYTLDYNQLAQALIQKYGGEWVVMLRLHPLIINLKDKLGNTENIIDATDYSDMQELLVSADVLITDYSSCIYDFMLSNKPGFIYATDVKKYDNGRGLYYPLTSTPFPVAVTNKEMVKNVLDFDYDKYQEKVRIFLKDKGCIEDGQASKKVVELIKKIIDEAENSKT